MLKSFKLLAISAFILSILAGCSSIYDFMFDAGGENSKPYIVMETPVNGTKVATNFTVTGTARGVRAKLKRITVYYESTNGAASGNAPAGAFLGKYTSSVDLTSFGFYYVWAEAEDDLGNRADTSASRVMINAANIPILHFIVPVSNGRDHYTNTNNIPVNISASIVGATVTNIRLIVNYGSGPDQSFDFGVMNTLATNLVFSNNVTNLVQAVAFSDNGETSQTQFVRMIVDTVLPDISMTTPTNGQFVNGLFTVSATASDPLVSGIDRVELYIDGTNKGSANTSPYQFNWDTTAHLEAAHEVVVMAYDLAGNRQGVTNTVSVMQAVCVSPSLGNDANFGYKTSPMKNIQSAITQAVRLGLNQLYLSAETFLPGNGLNAAGSGILITNRNMRFIGGYNAGFTGRVGQTELDGTNGLYHVIMISGVTNIAIDGLTIRNGFANGSFPNSWGGGLFVYYGTNIRITNSLFSNNTGINGGGLSAYFSQSLDIGADFIGNISTNGGNGGGAFLQNSSSINIAGNFISNNGTVSNLAGSGGGLMLSSSSMVTVHGDFLYNNGNVGGGLNAYGNYIDVYGNFTGNVHYSGSYGGGGCYARGQFITLTGDFMSNSSSANGAGIYMYQSANFRITGNILYNNAGFYGGGICLEQSGSCDINADIVGNTVSYYYYSYAGGMYALGDHINFTGNVISNQALGNHCIVGGLYMHGNYININAKIAFNHAYDNASGGAAILLWGNTNSFTGSIINNRVSVGAYSTRIAFYAVTSQNLKITNCVISNNYGGGQDCAIYVDNSYYPNEVLISNCVLGGSPGSSVSMIRVGTTNLTGFILKDNIFLTNQMGNLFVNCDGTTVTNSAWTNINDPVWISAAQTSGNTVTN